MQRIEIGVEDEDGWTVYFDEAYKAYYRYNSKSNESEWMDSSNLECIDSKEDFDEATMDEEGVQLLPNNRKAKSKKKSSRSHSHKKTSLSSADTSEPWGEWDSRISWRWRMVILNAILMECPLAAVESICRSALCFVAGAIIVLCSILLLNKYCFGVGIHFIIESALSLACAISLCIPILPVVLIYRSFDPTDDGWCMHPVITVLGNVDVRRLCVFAFGGGSSGANAFTSVNCDQCQDTWGHRNLLFFPRPFLAWIESLQYDCSSIPC